MQAAGSNRFSSPTYLFVASEVRSGSTYVAELISYSLKETCGYDLWDLAKEHLRDLDDGSTAAEIKNRISSLWLNPDNIRSSKIMCAQLSIINRWARRDPDLKQLAFGENARWIVVRRRDKIRQAVSLAVARQSSIFHNYDSAGFDDPVDVAFRDVEDALRAVVLSDEYLQLFSAVPKYCSEIFYEDVLEDPKACISKALTTIGVLPSSANIELSGVKITPDHQCQKDEIYKYFSEWLLENHHPVSDEEEIID